MKEELFNELLTSVKQADDIIQGKSQAHTVTAFDELEVKAIRTKTGNKEGVTQQVQHEH